MRFYFSFFFEDTLLYYVAHMRWTQRYGIVAIAIVVVLALIFVLQQKSKNLLDKKKQNFFFVSSRTL